MLDTTATEDPLVEGLFASLPHEGSHWPADRRAAWLTLAAQIFDYLYRSRKCEGCERAEADVDYLVQFKSQLCICDECVSTAVEIIAERKADKPTISGDIQEATSPVSSVQQTGKP